MKRKSLLRNGFTLIELSIVLVIIGLIVGSVLAGRDLIRAAELRSVISDVERIRIAANTFIVKYDCFPGDCANAQTFFGTDSLGCPTGGGPTGTCNGDGNGSVDYFNFVANVATEPMRLWQQLGQAGYIKGNYKGVWGSGMQPGVNIFSPTFGAGGAMMIYNMTVYGESALWADCTNTPGYCLNRLMAGMPDAADGNLDDALYIPMDAQWIDQKVDDGLPASGRIWGSQGVDTPGLCTSGNTYILTTPTRACYLVFTLDYN